MQLINFPRAGDLFEDKYKQIFDVYAHSQMNTFCESRWTNIFCTAYDVKSLRSVTRLVINVELRFFPMV